MVMHLGPNTKQQYSVGNSEHLSPVDETRDLDIWMDSNMKFSMQCSKAANKAMQALGQIKRTFKCITPHSFIHQASLGTLHTSLETIFGKGYRHNREGTTSFYQNGSCIG